MSRSVAQTPYEEGRQTEGCSMKLRYFFTFYLFLLIALLGLITNAINYVPHVIGFM